MRRSSLPHRSLLVASTLAIVLLMAIAIRRSQDGVRIGRGSFVGSVVTIGVNPRGIPVKLIRFDDSQSATLDNTSIYMAVTGPMDAVTLDNAILTKNGLAAAYYGYQYTSADALIEKQHRDDVVFAVRFPGKFFASFGAQNDPVISQELATFSQQKGVTFLPTNAAATNAVRLEPHSLYVFTVAESGATISIPLSFSRLRTINAGFDTATIKWHTNLPADTQVEYGVSAGSYTQHSDLQMALTNEHHVILTGLISGQTYHARLRSKTAVGVQGQSQDFTFATNAFSIMGITTELNGGSAIIEWDTDQTSTSQVDFGMDDAYGSGSVMDRAGKDHHRLRIPCCRLAPGAYHFRLTSKNVNGAQSASVDRLLTMPAAERLFISNLLVDARGDSATISWKTNKDADALLEYGSGGIIDHSRARFSGQRSHTFTLSGLRPDTVYSYHIRSRDDNGFVDHLGDETALTFQTSSVAIANPVGTTVDSAGNPIALGDPRTAIISWMTDPPLSCDVQYGLLPDAKTWDISTLIGSPNGMTIHDLLLHATYHARVSCLNASALSRDFVFRSGDGDPPIISDLLLRPTATGTVFSWKTDRPTLGRVQYGTASIYGQQAIETDESFAHSIAVPSQFPGTTYTYRIVAGDAYGTEVISPVGFWKAGYADLWIKNIVIRDVTDTTAVVEWETSVPTDTFVEYGTDLFYAQTAHTSGSATSHSILLTNMVPSTIYNVRIRSALSGGNEIVSSNMIIQTTTGTPVVSGLHIEEAGSDSVTLSWHTNEAATSQASVMPFGGAGVDQSVDVLTRDHRMTFTGLAHNAQFVVRVTATDASGNTSLNDKPEAQTSFATTDVPRISLMRIQQITSSSALLVWRTNRSTDAQIAYGPTPALGSVTQLVTTPSLTHTTVLKDLLPATLYSFRILARDSAGVLASSNIFTVATQDTVPPVISAVLSSALPQGGITISWTTDEDADTWVRYGPDAQYGNTVSVSDSTQNHTMILSQVPAGLYHYQVMSIDASGNVATSDDATFMIAGW